MQTRLDDNSVDCVITDPPYGIDVEISMEVDPSNPDTRSKKPKHDGSVDNDHNIDTAIDLFRGVIAEMNRIVKPDGHIYVFASWKTGHEFRKVIDESTFELRNRLVWVKDNPVTMHTWGDDGKPSYAYKYEDIFFACSDGASVIGGSPDDVLQHSGSRFSDMSDGSNYHPTQKPVSLISELIINSTDEGDTILDPFMGSGTTAVAAIQNNRDYIGFELDAENYQNVIERRISEAKRQVEANTD
jgi:DNA modification methylase